MNIKAVVAFLVVALTICMSAMQNQKDIISASQEDKILSKYQAERVAYIAPELKEFLAKAIKQQYGTSPSTEIELYALRDLPIKTIEIGGSGRQTLEETSSRVKEPNSAPVKKKERKSANGVIIAEKAGEVYLDVNPCNAKLLSIHDPDKKEIVGKKKCGDKEHEIVVVTFFD